MEQSYEKSIINVWAIKGVGDALSLSIKGLASDTFNHVAGVFRSPRSLIIARKNNNNNKQADRCIQFILSDML